jgi:hypothetical protein
METNNFCGSIFHVNLLWRFYLLERSKDSIDYKRLGIRAWYNRPPKSGIITQGISPHILLHLPRFI